MSLPILIFLVAAIVANIAIPYFFIRDIRRREPALWEAIGSPSSLTESAGSLVSKSLKGLRRLSSDATLSEAQRRYCRRYWLLLLLTYIAGGVAILVVVATRFRPHAY